MSVITTQLNRHRNLALVILISVISVIYITTSTKSPTSTIPPNITTITVTDKKTSAPKTLPLEKITPYTAGQITITDQDFFIGLDNKSVLNKYTSKTVETLYQKPIEYYSFSNNNIAFIEKENPTLIKIIDLRTKKITSLNSEKYSPVIALALSPDGTEINFLGNYDQISRKSGLFVSKIDEFSPTYHFSTTANKIDYLSPSKLLLFENIDGKDSSIVSIVNISTNQTDYNARTNSYSLSPSKNLLLTTTSDSLTLTNLMDNTSHSFSFKDNDFAAWANEKIIIHISNQINSAVISYIDSTTLNATAPVNLELSTNAFITKIIGVTKNILYVQDNNGKIWQLTLRLP